MQVIERWLVYEILIIALVSLYAIKLNVFSTHRLVLDLTGWYNAFVLNRWTLFLHYYSVVLAVEDFGLAVLSFLGRFDVLLVLLLGPFVVQLLALEYFINLCWLLSSLGSAIG